MTCSINSTSLLHIVNTCGRGRISDDRIQSINTLESTVKRVVLHAEVPK